MFFFLVVAALQLSRTACAEVFGSTLIRHLINETIAYTYEGLRDWSEKQAGNIFRKPWPGTKSPGLDRMSWLHDFHNDTDIVQLKPMCGKPLLVLWARIPVSASANCDAKCDKAVYSHMLAWRERPARCMDLTMSKEYDVLYSNFSATMVSQPGMNILWYHCVCSINLIVNRLTRTTLDWDRQADFLHRQTLRHVPCNLKDFAFANAIGEWQLLSFRWLKKSVSCATRDPVGPRTTEHLKVLYGEQRLLEYEWEKMQMD